MRGYVLRFYMHESQRQGGVPLYDWLLEQARRENLPGGSAFRAIAGFGRHGVISQQSFFELAGQLTVTVEFIVDAEQAERMLTIARRVAPPLFHSRAEVEYGVLEPPVS